MSLIVGMPDECACLCFHAKSTIGLLDQMGWLPTVRWSLSVRVQISEIYSGVMVDCGDVALTDPNLKGILWSWCKEGLYLCPVLNCNVKKSNFLKCLNQFWNFWVGWAPNRNTLILYWEGQSSWREDSQPYLVFQLQVDLGVSAKISSNRLWYIHYILH